MRLMGIDYGSKRVGIALSDERGEFAMPHGVLANDKALVPAIAELCRKNAVSAIVVGKSQDYHGQDNPIMKKADAFAAELRKVASAPVVFEPEFLTSREASHIQGETAGLDASAAALILKSYIDRFSRQ